MAGSKLGAILLIGGLALAWLEKWIIIIALIGLSLIVIRLIADLFWWIKDKNNKNNDW